jgi:hypothetical protein
MADFTQFKLQYGYVIKKVDCWRDAQHAFQDFKVLGEGAFLVKLNEQLEYTEFCEEFYDTLREHWNICSAGMWEEFQKLKEKGWSFEEYRIELHKSIKAQRQTRKN